MVHVRKGNEPGRNKLDVTQVMIIYLTPVHSTHSE
jgi:hypothetical protein